MLQRTACYVAQTDYHVPTLTVDETLSFAETCLVGAMTAAMCYVQVLLVWPGAAGSAGRCASSGCSYAPADGLYESPCTSRCQCGSC